MSKIIIEKLKESEKNVSENKTYLGTLKEILRDIEKNKSFMKQRP